MEYNTNNRTEFQNTSAATSVPADKEKTKRKPRHVVEKGVPKFACIELYEEKANVVKHTNIDENTYAALSKYAQEISAEGEKETLGHAASDLIGDALDQSWKPFEKPVTVRPRFTQSNMNVAMRFTKSDSEKLTKLAESSGISENDYIRLALCWKLVMNNDFSKRPSAE